MDIGNYMQWLRVILAEAGKYFLVLLLAVLAIRLWRWCPKAAGSQRRTGLAMALLASAAALAVGYVSVRHSLSRLYDAYGMKAFKAGRLRSALALFDRERGYWSSADVLGKEGASLLLLGDQRDGMQCLAQAKAQRHGQTTPFEDYCAGLFYFLHEQPRQAAPCLAAARRDENYWGNATKMLAVIALEEQHPAEAAQLMAPLQQAEITGCDQAYVMASLDLADGKAELARSLLGRFPTANMPAFWKGRFERLRAKLDPKAL